MAHQSSEEEYELVGESDYEYIEEENSEKSEEEEAEEEFQEEEKTEDPDTTNNDLASEYDTVVSDYTYPTSRGGDLDQIEEEETEGSWTKRLNHLLQLFQGSLDASRMGECAFAVQALIEAMKMSLELTHEQLELLVIDVEALLIQMITLDLSNPYVGNLLADLVDDLLGFGWDCMFNNAVIHDILYSLAQTHTNLNCIRTAVKQVFFIVDKGQWLHKADALRIAEAAILGNWLGDLQVYIYAVQLYAKLLEDRTVDLIITPDLRVHSKLGRCDVRYVPPKHQLLALCIQAYLVPRLQTDSDIMPIFRFQNFLEHTDLYKIWIRPHMFWSRSFRNEILMTCRSVFSKETATTVFLALYVEWIQDSSSPEPENPVAEWFRSLVPCCDEKDPALTEISSYLDDVHFGNYGFVLQTREPKIEPISTTAYNETNSEKEEIEFPSLNSEDTVNEVITHQDEPQPKVDETACTAWV